MTMKSGKPFLDLRREKARLFLMFCGVVGSGELGSPAYAQLITQSFPSELPGYSADSTGIVSLREVLRQPHAGINVGSFIFHPSVSQKVGYNGSILGASHTGGLELDSMAGLGLNSNWSRHSFGVSASVKNTAYPINNKYYPSLSEAGYTDWNVAAGGGLNLGHDTLSAGYSHAVKHLSATQLGNFGVGYPVPYAVDDARLSYRKNWTRIALIPSVAYDDFSFGEAAGSIPTAGRNTHSLSHQLETQMLQLRYEISKGNALLGIIRTSEAQFVSVSDGHPADYISGGGFVGLDLRADAVWQYRALIGAETRHFVRGGGRTLTTPTAELEVIWMPDKLDTFTLTGQRGLFDPTSAFSRNQIVSTVQLEEERELLRDVFFSGQVGFARTDSFGASAGSAGHQQVQFRGGAGVDWQFNRDFKLTLKYMYTKSKSKLTGSEEGNETGIGSGTYTNQTVSLGVAFTR
ncbi:outer membrane beta-barrel protein [Acetobacter estunensis]|uniref:Outer membrane beta-barrel protein n=2 Tax=Acetobacter estunensis TaxID=104097 RepID=A0A967ECV9_9PROT|nr:outer membrane beta-barrel protein [Acetobacter estunensis]